MAQISQTNMITLSSQMGKVQKEEKAQREKVIAKEKAKVKQKGTARIPKARLNQSGATTAEGKETMPRPNAGGKIKQKDKEQEKARMPIPKENAKERRKEKEKEKNRRYINRHAHGTSSQQAVPRAKIALTITPQYVGNGGRTSHYALISLSATTFTD